MTRVLVALHLVFAVLTAAGTAYAATESDKLNAWFEKVHEEDLRLSPEFQGWLGITWDQDKLDDDSLEQLNKNLERQKRLLKELRAFDKTKLDEQTLVSYQVFEYQTARGIDNAKFRDHAYGISHNFGVHSDLPSFLINNHQIKETKDAKAYMARLKWFPKKFQWTIERLERGRKLGILPPKFAYPQIYEASENVLSGEPFNKKAGASPIWEDFRKKVDELKIEDKEKAALMSEARDVLIKEVEPAYGKLVAYLRTIEKDAPVDGGAARMPDGAAYYNAMLAYHTSTDYTADAIYDLGVKEVARIHGEMRQIMKKVGFKGELKDFFEFLKTDKQFKYENSEAGRKAYLDETNKMIAAMEKRLPEMFGILPKAKLEVRAVEKYREESAGIAFYNSPSLDGTRPGIYYVNLSDMDAVAKYEMEALAYHEAVPGHHMQIAIAMELEELPEFRKHGWFTAYGEGWGLYTEYLPKEYGFYTDPYSDFGRLSMELWRACRLVVDAGIHAKKWTGEQAKQYLRDNTPSAEGDVVKSIERYMTWPGQATAYKVGMIKIQELRDQAKKALGGKFDIRSFHDEVLKNGAVPLAILEERINAFVERSQKTGH